MTAIEDLLQKMADTAAVEEYSHKYGGDLAGLQLLAMIKKKKNNSRGNSGADGQTNKSVFSVSAKPFQPRNQQQQPAAVFSVPVSSFLPSVAASTTQPLPPMPYCTQTSSGGGGGGDRVIQYDRQRLCRICELTNGRSAPSELTAALKQLPQIRRTPPPMPPSLLPPSKTKRTPEKPPSIAEHLPLRPNMIGFVLDPVLGAWVPRARPGNGRGTY